MKDPAAKILRVYEQKGDRSYGEGVSMRSHALQAAMLAEQEQAGPALIAAALLHDIGHLLHDLPEDVADMGLDSRHESIGSAWLSQYFPPAVSEPVRLHVAAKRYLCAADPGYRAELSRASIQSLALQGGPMSPVEAERFELEPYWQASARLRRWDDQAKRPDLAMPDFARYRPLIQAALRP
jgi:[1-hydroxy-2-(trimethylamino)ethyl]phosphonate dioxygenase